MLRQKLIFVIEGAALICLVYYLVLVVYAGITADFAWIWLFGAVILSAAGHGVNYDRCYPDVFPGWLKYLAAAVVIAGLLFLAAAVSLIMRGMSAKGSRELDYVVVLGAQVRGDKPSRALQKRLDAALAYAKKNPKTRLILSGGQGSGEDISEAQCMAEYLMEQGMDSGRLILEEKSTDTRENLLFSDKLTGCSRERTGVLSNNFHVYRAVRLAKKLGYERVEGIAAPSDPVMQVHYVIREVFALVKEKISGNI